MRILSPIIQPPAGFLAIRVAYFFHRSAIGVKLICHNNLRTAISLHGFLQKLQGCSTIARLGDESFKNFSFMINGSP